MKTDSILSKAEARVSRGYVEGLSGKELRRIKRYKKWGINSDQI